VSACSIVRSVFGYVAIEPCGAYAVVPVERDTTGTRLWPMLQSAQHVTSIPRMNMDDDELTFGQWLQRRRKALHLTQQQLGHLAGAAGETIRKLEADERRPSADVARLLARALQIPDAEQRIFLRFARGEALVEPPALP